MYRTGENEELGRLQAAGNLRELRTVSVHGSMLISGGKTYVNLSSNDYLGIGSDTLLQEEFFDTIGLGCNDRSATGRGDTDGGTSRKRFLLGNPASRLMTGNSPDYNKLETALLRYHGYSDSDDKAALVLGSGYLLNCGLPGAICSPDDLILADKFIHASLIDGLRLSGAQWERYRHNDTAHLEKLLQRNASGAGKRVTVVTESLFSMDGDWWDAPGIARLQRRYGFRLYVDAAHSFGVFPVFPPPNANALPYQTAPASGNTTGGHPEALSPQNYGQQTPGGESEAPRIDFLAGTFGKAAASQGAFVICSREDRELLVNKMRTLIFSTALPPISLQWTRFVVGKLASSPEIAARRVRLTELINILGGRSQIIPVVIGDNHRTLEAAARLRSEEYWVSAIRPPTVAEGAARLRISLTAAHTVEQITRLAGLCRNFGVPETRR